MKVKFFGLLMFVVMASVSEARPSSPAVFPMKSWNSQNLGPCIQIFYDQSKDPKYWMGRTYSIFLQNLLAHFPKYQQITGPIEQYQKGDLDRCDASFYIASYFENAIPKEFFEDYAATTKPVMWMGYSVWLPGNEYFNSVFGYTYSGLTKLNTEVRDAKGKPTYFKFASYKGKTFRKFGEFSRTDPTQFLAPFENVMLRKTSDVSGTQIISELTHNGSKEKIPYILRNKNRFYVADVPFSFMHEADRFLIVADLLFDVLNESPMHNEKIAFLRIEDVSPYIPLPFTYDLIKVLQDEKVTANVSIVPIFTDPLRYYPSTQTFIPMEKSPGFMLLIEDFKKLGFSFIWHGVTHQYEDYPNPYNAVSTDDFEFWDAPKNRPVPKDSVAWVLNRLQEGLYSLSSGAIEAVTWLTPHYQASSLDYYIFGRIFSWNVGRVIYFDHSAQNVPKYSSDLLMASSTSSYQKRFQAFKNLKVETTGPWNGQMFPYLIYGDVYGQRLIPENLGNSQPFKSEHVVWPRTLEEILEDAKRNLVLRDTWASLFYHPSLLDNLQNGGRGQYPGDPNDLRRLVKGLKGMGYRFVNMDEVHRRWHLPIRKVTLTLEGTR